jgi:hypothetical protein
MIAIREPQTAQADFVKVNLMKKRIVCIAAIIAFAVPLFAQNHVSVALDAEVYRILEQAETRGLCGPLPGVKPYSRAAVLKAIDTILDTSGSSRSGAPNGKLTEAERRILVDMRDRYRNAEKDGLDMSRGTYHIGSADIGAQIDTTVSGGLYPDAKAGGENWVGMFIRGDIGPRLSYTYRMTGSPFIYAERDIIGSYHTYYDGFPGDTDDPPNNINQTVVTYGQPLGYFPYTYKKGWDSSIWSWQKVDNSGQTGWPEDISIGYQIRVELGGSFFDDRLAFRFGRMDREWGAMTGGGSLILNQAANPFMAVESTLKLFDALPLSTITGILEYDATRGLTDNSFQNAFSLTMLEFNYKHYFHIDVGSISVWAKRFELGYLFPDPVAFLYQGTIGDYDNVAAFLNLKGTAPGIGKLWFSLFLDEINFEKDIFELDRAMYAWQTGIAAPLPVLPFAQITLTYTKIEPYCYTHTRDFLPWYGDTPMERAYVNSGASLGHYLPPNADELLLRFEAALATKTRAHVQYQMIRHGADHGTHAVDGSALLSELAPAGRSENPILRKYFLRDGAYQWMHIIKIGAEHTFAPQAAVPVRLFAETGVVLSYYTCIDGPANSGAPSPYRIIDTAGYPKSTAFIATIGIRFFP